MRRAVVQFGLVAAFANRPFRTCSHVVELSVPDVVLSSPSSECEGVSRLLTCCTLISAKSFRSAGHCFRCRCVLIVGMKTNHQHFFLFTPVSGINRNSPSRASIKIVLPPVIPNQAKDASSLAGQSNSAPAPQKVQGNYQLDKLAPIDIQALIIRSPYSSILIPSNLTASSNYRLKSSSELIRPALL